MIKTVTKDSGLIPYWDNIIAIHREQPALLHLLDKLGPIYCGGYPMALVLAPRDSNNQNAIASGFYQDIDVYGRNQQHLSQIIEFLDTIHDDALKAKDAYTNKIVTDNAISYVFQTEKGLLRLQVVKKFTGTPEQVLETFDFINCAFAYTPQDNKLFYHHQAPAFHKAQQLEILDPWMLKNVHEGTLKYVIIQLIRFKKYAWRWGYTIGPNAFKTLLGLYKLHPELKVMSGAKLGVGSDEKQMIARKDFNVWYEMACLFKQTKWWQPHMDTFGHINAGSSGFTPDDQIIRPAKMPKSVPKPKQPTPAPAPSVPAPAQQAYKPAYSQVSKPVQGKSVSHTQAVYKLAGALNTLSKQYANSDLVPDIQDMIVSHAKSTMKLHGVQVKIDDTDPNKIVIDF